MIGILLALPLLLVLVLFALSNAQSVHLAFWPTDLGVDVPLSLVVLGGMAIAFVVGALVLWVSAVSARGRARRAERKVRELEGRVKVLEALPVTYPQPIEPVQATYLVPRS